MLFNDFKRKVLVRDNRPLISGRILDVEEFDLPRESVLHSVPKGIGSAPLRANHLLLLNNALPFHIYFEQTPVITHGSPRHVTFTYSTFLREYKANNAAVTVERDLGRAALRNKILIGVDYTPATRSLTYGAGYMAPIDAIFNNTATVAKNVNALPEKNHFLYLAMPKSWPERMVFKRNEKDFLRQDVDLFSDSTMLWLLEIHRMLLGSESLLDLFAQDNVYFCFSCGTKLVTIGVDALKSFKDGDNDAAKHFYILMTTLQETLTADNGDTTPETVEAEENAPEVKETVLTPAVQTQVKELVDLGRISGPQLQRIKQIAADVPALPNPFNPDTTVGELQKPDPTVMAPIDNSIPSAVNKLAVPPGAEKATSTAYIREYVEQHYHKDVINMLTGFSKGGIFVQSITAAKVTDAINEKNVITVSTVPVNGKSATFPIDLPVIRPDGSFLVKGVQYTMDAQKVDMPVRKVKEDQASITSYAGKMFVSRSDLSKYSFERWLVTKITHIINDPTDNRVTTPVYNSEPVTEDHLPLVYAVLMRVFGSFVVNTAMTFMFAYSKLADNFTSEELAYAKQNQMTPVGRWGKSPLYMDAKNVIYTEQKKSLGFIQDVIGNMGAKPSQVAFIRVRGRDVPVVVMLGYLYGLTKLLDVTKVDHTILPLKELRTPQTGELMIRFMDAVLYVRPKNFSEEILWNGLVTNGKFIKLSEIDDFDKKNIWKVLASENFRCKTAHFLEWELINDLFVDPITEEVLRDDMKLSTDIKEIILYAVGLLNDSASPRESDPRFLRHRGLERISGMLYLAMYNQAREQRRAPNPGVVPVSIPPYAVMEMLGKDATTQMAKRINPVDQLKETEAVSLAGEGGRTARTLVKRHRSFDPNDLGIVSEGTPDSAKVGIRAFVPPNIKLKNIRGVYGAYDPATDNATNLLSTSANVLADSDRDDGKRSSLAGGQASHVVPIYGGQLAPYYSAYNMVIGSRVSDFFVFVAKANGNVTKVTDTVIQVMYDGGVSDAYAMTVRYGKSADTIIPQPMVTDMEVGDAFKKGDVLAWNKYFFSRDFFSPQNVVMKTSTQCTIALMEGNGVLEDGSLLVENSPLADKMKTPVSKEIGIKVAFNQEIVDILKEGDKVDFDTAICTIADTVANDNVSDKSLEVLKQLGNATETAGKKGYIGKIQVFYMGDINDMSPSLQALVTADNARRKKAYTESEGKGPGQTGQVLDSVFIGGKRIEPNSAVILFNIDSTLGFTPGDKLVLFNQLKSIPGGTIPAPAMSVSKVPLDILFGFRSVLARIVGSPFYQGTKNRVVRHRFESLADEYLNG